ncbi:MAG: prepilin peptidase [Coprococcus sp.]|nr:prepilin peptidase [Coprococcus sp.]
MTELWIRKENAGALLTAGAFTVILIFTAVSDSRTKRIPDLYSAGILLLSLLSAAISDEASVSSRLIGLFCVSVPMLLLTTARPGAFGGGDIKLMAACGAFLGWESAVAAMGIAIFAGGAASAVMLLTRQKSRKERFAFGPFLCIGAEAAFLWGQEIWEWLVSIK